MTEKQVLRRAKEVLLERGWHQGEFCTDPMGERGRVCLVGALGVAVNGSPYTHADTLPAARVLERALGVDHPSAVARWNDDDAMFPDVIALIDRAIASLPAEEVTPEGELAHA